MKQAIDIEKIQKISETLPPKIYIAETTKRLIRNPKIDMTIFIREINKNRL